MTADKDPGLLPCPFCASSDVRLFEHVCFDAKPQVYKRVQCNNCKAENELSKWNTRPAPHSSGMVLVPVEPTEAMIKAGSQYVGAFNTEKSMLNTVEAYKAMIAAKPSVVGEKNDV